MQCDSADGECWCVDKMGIELPRTRIRGDKQYCDVPGKLRHCTLEVMVFSVKTVHNHYLKLYKEIMQMKCE